MRIITFFSIVIIFFAGGILGTKVIASGGSCKGDQYKVPAACPNDYIINFNCQNLKIIEPSSEEAQSCCMNVCKNSPTTTIPPVYSEFNVFGLQIQVDFSKTETYTFLLNLLISTALGIFSFYALGRGVYIAAFQRTQAVKPDDIAKLNKQFTSLVTGFVLAWGTIVIVQIVFTILGLGSVTSLNISNLGGSGTVITIGGNK